MQPELRPGMADFGGADDAAAGQDHVLFLVRDFIAEEIGYGIGLLFEGGEVPLQFVGKDFYKRCLSMGRAAAKKSGE